MAYTSKEIIDYINHNYAPSQLGKLRNCSDLNLQAKVNYVYQYIVGVAANDPMGNDIRHYEQYLKDEVGDLADNIIKSLPWSFNVDEIEELKSVLKDLSNYFEADLEIDKMIEKAKRIKSELYYAVITVVSVPVLYVD